MTMGHTSNRAKQIPIGTWGAQVVEALRQAATVTPAIDDEGRAVFSIDGQPVFVLYHAEEGSWKFHL